MKCSVIIPTYNRGNVIRAALESVLFQTFQDFEIIIINDGSTDNTHERLKPYLQKSSRIRYFITENSGSPSRARNFAISKATGEYIAFLDSDDLWVDSKLEETLVFLETNGYDWVTSATYRVSDGNFDDHHVLRILPKYLEEDGKTLNLIKYGLFSFTAMPIFPGAVVIKKSVFEKVGGFDEEFLIGEDSDLWMKLAEAGCKGGYLDVPLYYYNKNETSISRLPMKSLDDNLRLARKHLKLLKMPRRIIKKSYSDFLWEYSAIYYVNGKILKGLLLLLKSFFMYPEIEKFRRIGRHFRLFLPYLTCRGYFHDEKN